MIHFFYLVGYSFFVAIAFAVFHDGTTRERVFYGVKTFFEFVLISLLLAWILYFIPW
jgi:hypothetical protein